MNKRIGRPPLPISARQKHIAMRAEAIYVFDHFCERQARRIMAGTLGVQGDGFVEDLLIQYREDRLGDSLGIGDSVQQINLGRTA